MSSTQCPRCHRNSPGVARYCGRCGHDLRRLAVVRPRPERRMLPLVMGLVLGGVFLLLTLRHSRMSQSYYVATPEMPSDVPAAPTPPALVDGGRIAHAGRVEVPAARTSARRIVYVCDASGAGPARMPALRSETERLIEGLSAGQWFNLVVCQEGAPVALDERPRPANASNKGRAREALLRMHGGGDPLEALELAFKQQPDEVWLLAAGGLGGAGNQAVLDYCRMRDPRQRVRINTVAVVEDEIEGEFVRAMRSIARDTGGVYLVLNRR